jgi:hypothetical protein
MMVMVRLTVLIKRIAGQTLLAQITEVNFAGDGFPGNNTKSTSTNVTTCK